jgi:hypothetical protein
MDSCKKNSSLVLWIEESMVIDNNNDDDEIAIVSVKYR